MTFPTLPTRIPTPFHFQPSRSAAVLWWVVMAAGIPGLCREANAANSGLAAFKKLSLAQLMDLEVTSVSRRPEILADAASAIQVVTGEEIRRAGATRIPGALRLMPNLQVAQIDSRQWAITSRGFNNTVTNKLLVQLDGRTLYTPLFAGVFWDVQDTLMEDIDRIEVISGPGATQWGSNAVNGVINITTRSARDTQGGLVTGDVGGELRTSGAVRHGGMLAPGLYYRIYGKYSERDASVTPDGRDAGDAWHTKQIGFRSDWDRGNDEQMTFQGDGYRGRIGQAANADIEVSGSNFIARWTRALGAKSEVSVQSYVDYTHRKIPGSITEHLYTYDLDVQHRLPLGRSHDFMWGGSFRIADDRVTNAPTIAFLPPKVRREWLSGFVQDEVAVLDDRLRLTGGLKLEHNPYTGWEFQPSARAGFKLRERQLLWAAISRALRTPSRIDRELYSPASPPFVLAGGPSFRSEKLLAYELGYRAELQSDLAVSIATFFHDYDDLRSVEPPDFPGSPSVIANGIEGRSYGAELSADYRVREWWRLRVGYTEQRVSSRPKPGSLDQTSTRSQALDPHRNAILNAQFDLPRNIGMDFTARYVGRISNQQVPAYLALDVRLSWHPIESLELALSGLNLLDHSHPEFGTPGTRREVERSLRGSFTWRF